MFRRDRLRQLRLERGLLQTELGERAGVSEARVGKYETGDSVPALDNLVALAQVLGTTTDYLCNLTDDPLPVSKRERAVLDALRKHYP